MLNIERLVPEAGRVDAGGLRAVDAEELARYVADSAHPWWRRKACVDALVGRVPESAVAELLACVRDTGDVDEVRSALLELLADRRELLPWLQHEDRRHERDYGMGPDVLKARGLLGDRSAARELATLAADPWRRARAAGEAGLDALVATYGVEAILEDIGDERPEDRSFGVRMRHRTDGDVTYAFADPDRRVAYLAASLAGDAERLRGYLDEAPSVEAKVWAVYALHLLTEDAAETRKLDRALGCPRVDVAGLDDELRGALVHQYASTCESHSDPRWRIEALCTEPPAWPDVNDQLGRAHAALAAAGLAPGTPVSCGDFHQQGDGTYHVITLGDPVPVGQVPNEVWVSTLGRFVTGSGATYEARQALESVGFRWIDYETCAIRATDLYVYYFGSRDLCDVSTLLFYWQD